jgi:hypothetical protein
MTGGVECGQLPGKFRASCGQGWWKRVRTKVRTTVRTTVRTMVRTMVMFYR